MYLVKTPWWLKRIYAPSLTWKMPTEKKEIFLTFDDGPHPSVTPFVLNCLKLYNAKATFFCIGKNVRELPHIYQQILTEGHSVGNHTFNHLNGWKSGDYDYIKNVLYADKVIGSNLFRPPYGRISRNQVKELRPYFDIIMWDVLSGDFDVNLSPQKCLENVTKHTNAGSIIVFHDSEKAFPRLEYVLPKALDFFAANGYVMRAIDYKMKE